MVGKVFDCVHCVPAMSQNGVICFPCRENLRKGREIQSM